MVNFTLILKCLEDKWVAIDISLVHSFMSFIRNTHSTQRELNYILKIQLKPCKTCFIYSPEPISTLICCSMSVLGSPADSLWLGKMRPTGIEPSARRKQTSEWHLPNHMIYFTVNVGTAWQIWIVCKAQDVVMRADAY